MDSDNLNCRPQPSGETREHGPKCWGKTSISDEMMYCYCGSTDSPPGETREAVARIIDPAGWATWDRQSGEIDRMGLVGVERSGAITSARSYVSQSLKKTDAILALLSTSPLALGGQQGEERPDFADAVDQFISDAIENASVEVMDGSVAWNRPGLVRTLRESLRECGYEIVEASSPTALSTTPARAEAQDEGAAGEEGVEVEYDPTKHDGFYVHREGTSICWMKDGAFSLWVPYDPAHPSPTPGADADRVREIVVEALGLTREMLAAGSDRSLILGHIDQALAALKSEEK